MGEPGQAPGGVIVEGLNARRRVGRQGEGGRQARAVVGDLPQLASRVEDEVPDALIGVGLAHQVTRPVEFVARRARRIRRRRGGRHFVIGRCRVALLIDVELYHVAGRVAAERRQEAFRIERRDLLVQLVVVQARHEAQRIGLRDAVAELVDLEAGAVAQSVDFGAQVVVRVEFESGDALVRRAGGKTGGGFVAEGVEHVLGDHSQAVALADDATVAVVGKALGHPHRGVGATTKLTAALQGVLLDLVARFVIAQLDHPAGTGAPAAGEPIGLVVAEGDGACIGCSEPGRLADAIAVGIVR